MNSVPSVGRTLEWLDRLRGAIRDFAEREARLNGGHASRTATGQRKFEEQSEQLGAEMAARLAEEESGHAVKTERLQARFLRRKAKINEAHGKVRNAVMGDITTDEGRRKYKIQERSLKAERRKESDLAQAVSAFQEFQSKLTAAGDRTMHLGAETERAFGGYRGFRRRLLLAKASLDTDPAGNENQTLGRIDALQAETQSELDRFRRRILPRVFRFLPIWLVMLALVVAGTLVPVSQHLGYQQIHWQQTGAIGFIALLLTLAYGYGARKSAPLAGAISEHLAQVRQLQDAASEQSAAHYQREQQRINAEFEDTNRALGLEWRQTIKGALDLRGLRPMEVDEQAQRAHRRNEHLHRASSECEEKEHASRLAEIRREGEARKNQLTEARTAETATIEHEFEAGWVALAADWKTVIEPLYRSLQDSRDAAKSLFPDWDSAVWDKWLPPAELQNSTPFARLQVDVASLAENSPTDPRLALPGPKELTVPLALGFPLEGSILFETGQGGHEEAVRAINAILFRLLSTSPPGKLSFTIIDPVGLGENFAALMHLADFEASSINSRIWTQASQIEEKLAELNEHMEKVIQMYLRNEYATITDYNAAAGTVAEKYHFLVIASFPVNFSDTAGRRLRNIAASGARCGVYTLVHWDQRQAPPHDFVPDELRKNSVNLVHTESGFQFVRWRPPGTKLVLEPPPSAEFATRFLQSVGQSGKDLGRVEVPFVQVAPTPDKQWKEETTEELLVPIGRSGATKLQYLEIGRGTRQHALIAGKTGSGKSTLFHVIITNLALWCSPEQVEFYLVDFKKGVEFKCYASRRLPHAKVVAIESDREFGLSVLQKVDLELRRRGDLFRQLGVQDLAGYKKAGGSEPMPRSLLIIDEFQEFFTEEDRVSQGAAVLLDRIVRQGRAFGIHVLLGSQTLGGAYTLARATIGQMVIRIALQCNEADAYLIMDQDNPAPRLLTRPGEGIYNDAAGMIEGNSPFQTVWLPESERDEYLARVRERADQHNGRFPGPFVFEGNAPAEIRENALLRHALQSEPSAPPAAVRTWFGAPNSIKGPTEAVFQRQSGSNLLVVGQSEERSLTLLTVALVALAAQYPRTAARFVLLDSTPPGSPPREFTERILKAIPQKVVQVNNSNLNNVFSDLMQALKQPSDEEHGKESATFLLIHGLQNYKKLRQEDEFSFAATESGDGVQPNAALQTVISDGPAQGFHVIATCDTYNNVNRFIGRKLMTEFEMRVLFQMSASDSASLIDSPDASTLGLHRALYYNDREGYTETFRPYALPGGDWAEEVTRSLARRARSK